MSELASGVDFFIRQYAQASPREREDARDRILIFHAWGNQSPEHALHFVNALGASGIQRLGGFATCAAGLAIVGIQKAGGAGSMLFSYEDQRFPGSTQPISFRGAVGVDEQALIQRCLPLGGIEAGAITIFEGFCSMADLDWRSCIRAADSDDAIWKLLMAFDAGISQRPCDNPEAYPLDLDDSAARALIDAISVWADKAQMERDIPAPAPSRATARL